MKYLKETVELLLVTNSWKATKYVSPKLTLRVTRRRYLRGDSFANDVELVVNFGRPNYKEREFIKKLKKSNEPFPVRKIQLKALPKRK